MRVMSFHLMPYADLDLSVKDSYRTVWVVLPNSYYDPKKGHADAVTGGDGIGAGAAHA